MSDKTMPAMLTLFPAERPVCDDSAVLQQGLRGVPYHVASMPHLSAPKDETSTPETQVTIGPHLTHASADRT